MRKLLLVLASACTFFALAPGALGATGNPVPVAVVPTDSPFGVSVAFDGKYLYFTDFNGFVLHRVNPLNLADRLDIPLAGAPDGINAFTFDATRNAFWGAGGDGATIYLIRLQPGPPITALATPEMLLQPTLGTHGDCNAFLDDGTNIGCQMLVDGIGYDATTDTIWFSPDGSGRIYQFDVNDDITQAIDAGTFLRGWFDVNDPPGDMAPQCGTNFSSGVAAGATILYLTNGDCASTTMGQAAWYFTYDKTTYNPPSPPCKDSDPAIAQDPLLAMVCPGGKIDFFPYDAPRAEDDECDDVTFAPMDVMWIRDGNDGFIRAYQIPPGTCIFGGGLSTSAPSTQGTNGVAGKMTGGGYLATPMSTTGKVHTSFVLNCNMNDKPHRLEVTWGGGNHFHMDTVTGSMCSKLVMTHPGSFDTITGSGDGRYNNQPGATSTWTFTDNGEPGTADVGRITVTDRSGNVVMDAHGTLVGGNYQAHS